MSYDQILILLLHVKTNQERLPRNIKIEGKWKKVKVESRGIEPWTSGLASQHYTFEPKRLLPKSRKFLVGA